jgi:hypothetical protein
VNNSDKIERNNLELKKLRIEYKIYCERLKYQFLVSIIFPLFLLVGFCLNINSDAPILNGAQLVMIAAILVFGLLGAVMFLSQRKSSLKAEIEHRRLMLAASVEEEAKKEDAKRRGR